MKNSYVYIIPFYLFGSIATFFAVATSLQYSFIPVTVINSPDLFNLIGFFWFTALVAHSNGISDAKKIKIGLGINHRKAFIIRVLWVLIAGIIMQINLLYVFSAGFFFSTIFNLTLTDARGLKWFYISDSNVYDRLFLAVFNASRTSNNTEPIIAAGKTKVFTEVNNAVVSFIIIYLIS